MIKQQGGLSKAVMIRLHPGEDLIQGITAACVAQGMQGGAVVSCIGSLQRASFFTVIPLGNKIGAGYGDRIEMEGPLELVSAQGTIGLDVEGNLLIHMHGALADGRGNLHGGHLLEGRCPVLITCEAMITFFEEVRAIQKYDAETDMKLLTFVGKK
jgi:predicted DNA-binding protein with PD1-like motif